MKRRSENKKSRKLNYTIRLTNCTHLNGNLTVTAVLTDLLVQVESPIHMVSFKIMQTDIVPFQGRYILCVANSSLLVTNHTWRKTLMVNHGLKRLKNTVCYKQPSSVIRLHLSKHTHRVLKTSKCGSDFKTDAFSMG